MDYSKYEVDETKFRYPNKVHLKAEAEIKLREAIDDGEKIYDTAAWITKYVNVHYLQMRVNHTEEQNRLEELFWEDAFEELGVEGYTADQLAAIRNRAWEDGHSSGYSEVFNSLSDLCFFLEEFTEDSKETSGLVATPDRLLSNLCMYAMRYTLDRATGAFWEVATAMKHFWNRLDPVTQKQIKTEIKASIPKLVHLPDDRIEEHKAFLRWIDSQKLDVGYTKEQI